jgi:peptide/nickel transport system permease protein
VHRYVLGRLVQALVSLFVVSMVVFALVRLSGDPIQIMAPPGIGGGHRGHARAPWPGPPVGRAVLVVCRGLEAGQSSAFAGRPRLILERYGATWARRAGRAHRDCRGHPRGRLRGRGGEQTRLPGAGLRRWPGGPALRLGLLSCSSSASSCIYTSGRGTPLHIVLPGITLGWFAVAGLMRLLVSCLRAGQRVRQQPASRGCRSDGHLEARVQECSPARGDVRGLLFVALLNGSIITETVFSWPGLSLWSLKTVDSRDYRSSRAWCFASAPCIRINLVVDVCTRT